MNPTLPQPSTRCRDRIALAFALAFVLAMPPAPAQTGPSKEYKLKAMFLLNFARFTEWPAAALPEANAALAIGVLGDDPFGTALVEAIQGETIHRRPLAIKQSRQLADLKNCQLLFISKSETARIDTVLAELKNTNILTVGETDGFATSGGIINFFTQGDKVRFEINLDAARRRGFKLSSQLLNLGKIVSSPIAAEKQSSATTGTAGARREEMGQNLEQLEPIGPNMN
jgi:hypothetical protein